MDTKWQISLNASVIRDEQGNAVRSRSIARDVTETKRLEQQVKQLSGRILIAQENERRLLARELHDDLTQRLAALAMDAAMIPRPGWLQSRGKNRSTFQIGRRPAKSFL